MYEIDPGYRWPAWAVEIAKMLNHIHAVIHDNQEKLMAEAEDLKAATEHVRTEVGEAIAKQSETLAKLAEAMENSSGTPALKAAVTEAVGELEAVAKSLDDAFGTGTFVPSGM